MFIEYLSRKRGSIKTWIGKLLTQVVTVMLLSGTVVTGNVWANNVVIDFEQFSQNGMYYYPGNSVPETSRLTDQLLSTYGVLFNSEAGYVAIVNLGTADADIGFAHAPSGITGIGGASSDNILRYASPITISFFDPANTTVEAVTNFVSIRGDLAGSGANATIEGFGIDGNLIASSTVEDTGGTMLSLSAEGIHSVKIQDNSTNFGYYGTIGFDDLTFGTLKYQTSGCGNTKHAIYSVTNNIGKLVIPFVDIPLLNLYTHQPTGELAVFSGELKQVGSSMDFGLVSSKLKLIFLTSAHDPCHALYDETQKTLHVPFVDVDNEVYDVKFQHLKDIPLEIGTFHLESYDLVQ